MLVADNDEQFRALLKENLTTQGFDIVDAADGGECFHKAKKLRPGLVFLDVDDLKMNAWEACRQMRANAETKHIPVVMLSRRADKESRAKAVACGASHYLSKPIGLEQLVSLVKALTRAAQVQPGIGRGKISWISQEQGNGFIVPDDGSHKIFFIAAMTDPEIFKSLSIGQKVAYEAELGPGGARAVRIRPGV